MDDSALGEGLRQVAHLKIQMHVWIYNDLKGNKLEDINK
jgi:hypothetical protein